MSYSLRVHHFKCCFAVGFLSGCLLLAACSEQTKAPAPKFTGRLLLLAGETGNGANLVELTPNGDSYQTTTLTSGVFEAEPSPDRARLLYATKEEVALRDVRSGSVKSLIKGQNFCLAWAPDGNHFSYKQRSSANADGPTTLFVADLEGKTKLIWADPFASYGEGSGQAGAGAAASFCAHWIAPDRLVFDRFVGVRPKQQNDEVIKPNTTTVATVAEQVKLTDSERKWSVEAICPSGAGAFLRPHDQSQPILVARAIDNLKTLDPKPIDCTGCRLIGFAAQSCVPFLIQDATSTSTDLVSLNPTNWQRQRAAHIERVFSPAAKMLIKSSARLMVAGDAPAVLLLIDTQSGEMVEFFPKSGPLTNPVPVLWIEN